MQQSILIGFVNTNKIMEKRTRIGFYYVWDKSWMGGVLYAQNLLKALNTLEDKNKPFIDVYCRQYDAFEELKEKTAYPYLDYIIINDKSFFKKAYRKLVGILFGSKAKNKVDMFKVCKDDKIIFPYALGSDTSKLLYWKPDFQEKYLPELFSKKEIDGREQTIRSIAERGIPIVFSSHDSENDFKRFYPEYSNKTFVVHFAVDHTDFSHIKIGDVKSKYGIEGEFLLCANQFWKHKNHLFLFKAYHKALQKGLKMQLVCTGNLSDYRNPEYIDKIKCFIIDNNLSKKILLLGLIDSDELHCLMKNAYAVIQPSLFEGWNTTVEDCKLLNKFIFLSDLSVHQEQVNKNVCFFNPHDEEDLCQKLLNVEPIEEYYDYSCDFREFGENFKNIIES